MDDIEAIDDIDSDIDFDMDNSRRKKLEKKIYSEISKQEKILASLKKESSILYRKKLQNDYKNNDYESVSKLINNISLDIGKLKAKGWKIIENNYKILEIVKKMQKKYSQEYK